MRFQFLIALIMFYFPFVSYSQNSCDKFFEIMPKIPIHDIVTRSTQNSYYKSVLKELEKYKEQNYSSAKNTSASAFIPLEEVVVGLGFSNSDNGWQSLTDYLKRKDYSFLKTNTIDISKTQIISDAIKEGIMNCTQNSGSQTGLFIYCVPTLNKLSHKIYVQYTRIGSLNPNIVTIKFMTDMEGVSWENKENRKFEMKIGGSYGSSKEILLTRDSSLINVTVPITADRLVDQQNLGSSQIVAK